MVVNLGKVRLPGHKCPFLKFGQVFHQKKDHHIEGTGILLTMK